MTLRLTPTLSADISPNPSPSPAIAPLASLPLTVAFFAVELVVAAPLTVEFAEVLVVAPLFCPLTVVELLLAVVDGETAEEVVAAGEEAVVEPTVPALAETEAVAAPVAPEPGAAGAAEARDGSTSAPTPQGIGSPFVCFAFAGAVDFPVESAMVKRVVQYVAVDAGDVNW